MCCLCGVFWVCCGCGVLLRFGLGVLCLLVFFFLRMSAFDLWLRLVGSVMCILGWFRLFVVVGVFLLLLGLGLLWLLGLGLLWLLGVGYGS